ncbi:MAG: GTP-dependent dephospho-CoA kinase family protein [Thermoplasmata archaeon]
MRNIPSSDLKLKPEDRDELKKTLGPVIEGELPSEYRDKSPIITVGDFVTDKLLRQGIVPEVSIVDGKTKRGEFEVREWDEEEVIHLVNPQSMITRESWEKVEEAIESDEEVTIYVDGEEDMLSLVSIALCPEGGIVIYGIPDEGMVINEITRDLKEKAWEIINKMIEVENGR